MTRFSERIGAVPTNDVLQIESMDLELRNSLWNFLVELYQAENRMKWKEVTRAIARDFRRVPIDEIPVQNWERREWLKGYFYSLQWHDVYDLIEFVVQNHERERLPVSVGQIIRVVNGILETERSGYRFVGKTLTPISDPVEVAAVLDALETSASHGLRGAHEHIRTAVSLLGKKPEPDYRNATKEAISAVESVAKLISGADNSTLDPALKRLAETAGIHGALRAGFSKIYGFTSDDDGIRHAILDAPTVGFAEAKYMVVSCSAFVNYLIGKADDAALLE